MKIGIHVSKTFNEKEVLVAFNKFCVFIKAALMTKLMSSSECAPPSVPSKTKSIDGGSTLHINLRVAANCGVLHQGPALVCQKSLFSDISVCLCRVWGV